MTYYQLNTLVDNTIKEYYGTGTTVQYTEGDIYKLNVGENTYPAFNFFLNRVTQNTKDEIYNVTLFYIDILNEGHSNELSIKNDGIETLKIILAKIDNNYTLFGNLIAGVTYVPFTERFTDECAGAYVQFQLQFPYDTICVD
jgi:hypothetical protein